MRIDAALTLTVLTEAVSGRDGYGNDIRTPTEVTYEGCLWWQRKSSENDDARETVVTLRHVLLPYDAVVSPTDRVRFPDGTVWRVKGLPDTTPMSGVRDRPRVVLQRVTG